MNIIIFLISLFIIYKLFARGIDKLARKRERERARASPILKPKTPAQIERERERARARENARLSALSAIDFYEPRRRALIDAIRRLKAEKADAEKQTRTVDAEKLAEKIERKKAELYRVEKTLEKSHFIIDEQ